jgi:hypothetical protein
MTRDCGLLVDDFRNREDAVREERFARRCRAFRPLSTDLRTRSGSEVQVRPPTTGIGAHLSAQSNELAAGGYARALPARRADAGRRPTQPVAAACFAAERGLVRR